jgi:hypothetical protein
LSKGIQFLSYFYNIDGNKKNFNSFWMELKRMDLEILVPSWN